MMKIRLTWKSALLTAVTVLLIVMGLKTWLVSSRFHSSSEQKLKLEMDSAAAHRLQQAVGIASISYDDSSLKDFRNIDSLIGFLKFNYPQTFRQLHCDTINTHSLLLHWKGSGDVTAQKPVLLYAHMDVVPADTGSENGWRFESFTKELTDDTIRGRGTVDDKLGVIGILEATERLIRKGFTPKRDIYFAFGHDEETGGTEGAAAITSTLKNRGIMAEWMLDEGGMVAEGLVPFVDQPVALVMTAEKGYITIDLTTEGHGGHSSFPPKESPIDILAAAIVRLNEKPLEATISEPVAMFMDQVGPAMRFPFNVVFANRWIFAPLVISEYEKIPEGNATIRTTLAWTMSQSGIKDNVLPSKATVTANLRILPGNTIESTLKEITGIIHDDRITIRVHPGAMEPIAASSTASEGYRQIQQAIHSTFPDAIVAPNLSIASTDSRHFASVAQQRFRFLPVRMDKDILSGMHGKNERVAVSAFMESILFYENLLGAQ